MTSIGTPLLQDLRHFSRATGFIALGCERLSVERDGKAAHHKVISPFVWREGQAYQAIFRAVPRSQAKDTNSQLICAEGDGLYFRLARDPILTPGPDDADGCEDPTVLRDDAVYTVFYSSVRGGGTESCLCYAEGAALGSLGKCGPVIIEPAYEYSKEMSTFKNRDGARTFYFESRANGASVVAVAFQNGSL
jgi:predicted GH43/DUF377 family glycosyl hydrolase